MQGMGRPLSGNNPLIVAAFHSALRHQIIIVALLLAVAGPAWAATVGAGRASRASRASSSDGSLEHPARRLARISFGLLWILDGILQAQSGMVLGMPTQVVQPAASGSPGWVQHLVNDGLQVWTRHPVTTAAAAVWIQIGLGMLLLVAPRGQISRLAGVAAVAWGVLVWIFGEAFGGIFASGLSWMFGAPGAVLLYCGGGVLVALPDRAWIGRRLGRVVLAVMGVFFVGMAVLQAWPGRGFWQGQANPKAAAGGLTSMVQTMSRTPQPGALTSLLNSFASFDAAHGWGVNLFVVAVLASLGSAFISGRPGLVRAGLVVGVVVCLADWVVVQDLGFLGGVGTDPNSMIPVLLILGTGYLALVRVPVPAEATVVASADPAGGALPASVVLPALEGPPALGPSALGPSALGPLPLAHAGLTRLLGFTAALAALGVVLVGAVPMAFAAANSRTDAILTEGVNGTPQQSDSPAPPFSLVDQRGVPVSLSSLRGRTVALTFLDPVCTTDCPTIAQEFRQADSLLGSSAAKHTAFVAIVANPVYRDVSVVQAFDRQEQLDTVPNWYFLTGSLSALTQYWNAYGIDVDTLPGGAMVAHSETAFVIDAAGKLRDSFSDDPGADSTTAASLATLLEQEMRAVMRT